MEATYEDLVRQAEKLSSECPDRYVAIVEVVTYRTGRSRMAVSVSRTKIRSEQRGCEFIGVVAQMKGGKGIYRAPKPTPVDTTPLPEGQLPF